MTLEDKINQLMNDHPDLFPTEAKVWQYIRGCMRRGFWEKSPMKFKFKASQMEPPPKGYKGRGKKGAVCSLTGEWTMTSQLEVDHKEGHKRLLKEEDIIPYMIHLLASNDEELQLASKEAHKIKSYAERMDLSFEEAKIKKKEIAFGKLSLEGMGKKLKEIGYSTSPRTKKEAKELYRKHLDSTSDH